MYKKILGCLVGAAAGDAMGAATEGRSYNEIIKYFGHKVTEFEIPPMDTFGAGSQAGQVTDDFSLSYFIAQKIVDNKGVVDTNVVKNGLIEWSNHPEFFDRFAGPTTRHAIRVYKGEEIEESVGVKLVTRQATNGATMKISPIGLINTGNIEKAINDSVLVTMVTHDNYLAISGACSLASGIAKAIECKNRINDIDKVIDALLYGAKKGEAIGRNVARDVAGPSVIKRLELAIKIAKADKSLDNKIKDLSDLVGTGLHISESFPTAVGIFVACDADPLKTIIEAVNIGYDTDTIATMAGALAGALMGIDYLPKEFIQTINKVNGFDLEKLASNISDLVR